MCILGVCAWDDDVIGLGKGSDWRVFPDEHDLG